MFANRSFLVIAVVAFAISVMTQGVFQALFPIYLKSERGLATSDIGSLTAIAGLATVLVLFPNGYIVDRFGRKSTLVPGLVVLGATALLLAVSADYGGLLLAVIVYGIGEGMCAGASQAYAMDLAPEDRRGAFLGVWGVLNSSGSIAAPLLIGFATQQLGFGAAFTGLSVALVGVALFTWVLGPNTRTRTKRAPTGEAPSAPTLAAR
jgi:MFS family permease